MIPSGKSKQFLRVTVDTEPADAVLLDELEEKSDLGSKREIFLTALRLLADLVRARRRGLRPQLIDPTTQTVTPFDWRMLPGIEPVRSPRRLFASKISEPTIRALRACASELRDSDLDRISGTITQAAWDPSGEGLIETTHLTDLIVLVLGLGDEQLLAVARDLLTQLCTSQKSFDALLAQALHGYRPSFETQHSEQRFLWDEYRRELPKKYPSEHAALRARGAL